MKRCVIVGRPNVGKTLLVLRLAEHLRADTVDVTFWHPRGDKEVRSYSISEAVRELVGPRPHQTRCLQSVVVGLPAGKGRRIVELVDTTGVVDYIHEDPQLRKAIAQTLGSIRPADVILHVLDAAEAGRCESGIAADTVDRQIADFAGSRGGYVIVANKMDLPEAARGLARLQRAFWGHTVVPVSAVAKTGLREVKRHVLRRL
ncbi:MAG: 50S ribosome-binding GTPase [Firmicutes bacterium]|jgi:predicted GTPase|nr:50S ribosome-binding GTPase [Bacillota bacterium]MDH7495101.1 50S ribosome-binding GTPase [Bacillota bacterium]